MKPLVKTIHVTWAQGAANMPAKYQANLNKWRKAMPGWDVHIWDIRNASERWEDFARIEKRCYHHATRSDLIQARVMRDIGGIYIGTDSKPAGGLPTYLKLVEAMEEGIVTDINVGAAMNCLSFSRGGESRYWSCVVRHQLRNDGSRLGDKNVHRATGPGCLWEALKAHQWDLLMMPIRQAYTHHWNGTHRENKNAFCDPGYAASWH